MAGDNKGLPFDHVHIEPFSYTMSLIGGKWKMELLYWLWQCGTLRYSDLKRLMKPITHKVLAARLDELEADGLVIRTEYPEMPPRVEYSLSELGLSLAPAMHTLCVWGTEHYPKDRSDYQEVQDNLRDER